MEKMNVATEASGSEQPGGGSDRIKAHGNGRCRARLTWAVAGVVALLGVGCGCTHVSYVTYNNVGVDLSAAPTEGNVKLVIGADRQTYALVPRKGDKQEAMSVTAASKVRVAGLRDVQFAHVIATGRSAIQLAQHPQNYSVMVDKIFGAPDKKPATEKKKEKKESVGGNSEAGSGAGSGGGGGGGGQ